MFNSRNKRKAQGDIYLIIRFARTLLAEPMVRSFRSSMPTDAQSTGFRSKNRPELSFTSATASDTRPPFTLREPTIEDRPKCKLQINRPRIASHSGRVHQNATFTTNEGTSLAEMSGSSKLHLIRKKHWEHATSDRWSGSNRMDFPSMPGCFHV